MHHRVRPLIPTLVLALAMALAACGGGGNDDARAAFIDGATAGGSELTEAQAGCIYDEVSDDLDADQLADFDFATEPDDPAVAEAVINAVAACLDS